MTPRPPRLALSTQLALLLSFGLACASHRLAPNAPFTTQGGDSGPSLDDDGGGRPANVRTGQGRNLTQMVEQLKMWGADVEDPDKICTGKEHSCGIDKHGVAHCWGSDENGRSTPPANLPPLVQITCGGLHTCALGNDGTIACWGGGTDPTAIDKTKAEQGQSIVPAGHFKEVSAGGAHTCAIDVDDKLRCWGAGSRNNDIPPNFFQASPPPGVFKGVSAGQAHSCAITLDTNEIVCWGAGDNIECFPPDSYDCGQKLAPPGSFTQVTAGEMHSCAIRTDGSIACWGQGRTKINCDPNSGGTTFDCGQAMPPPIPDNQEPFVRVRAGWQYTCGITRDYQLSCWGWNGYGQLKVPIATFSQVGSGGDTHVCGITTDGSARCWGAGGGIMVPNDVLGK